MTFPTLHAPHGNQPYTCPKCFQPCGSLTGFHRHMEKVHGESK